ncbi:hypothetical protein FQN49_001289 [Arthroderma sp. PD_2]|nr:hypothetical protein FQN49_001289 [Arthroderma sp. PD_2]
MLLIFILLKSLCLVFFVVSTHASPPATPDQQAMIKELTRGGGLSRYTIEPVRDVMEWTAIGDSYATGVGAGEPDEWRRCLRYSEAYPRLIQDSPNFPGPRNHKLNNVACSGATTEETLKEQFRDTDSSHWQYGKRPAFGKPEIATISVGGDDIDFLSIITCCILHTCLFISCEDQLDKSWGLIRDPKLVEDIGRVIDKTLEKGLAVNKTGFKVYVLGYARFFNEKTDYCSHINWSLAYDKMTLTKELRSTFNKMSIALNDAVQKAVKERADKGVVYIGWDDLVEGHRYCEEGKREPAPDDPDIWFYEYPFDTPEDKKLLNNFVNVLDPSQGGYNALKAGKPLKVKGNPKVDSKFIMDALFEAAWYDFGLLEALVNRVRMFHPKPQLLHKIRDRTIEYMTGGFNCDSDYQLYASKDKVIEAASKFCKEKASSSYHIQHYFPGTSDAMLLSLRHVHDENKSTPTDCESHFKTLADRCTIKEKYTGWASTTTDSGWVYFILPLSEPKSDDQKGGGGDSRPKDEPTDKKCGMLKDLKYVTRDTLDDLIRDTFCPKAEGQGALDENSGSISRRYLEGTVEEVDIAMDWMPGANFKPNATTCNEFLHVILDGCNVPSKEFPNPMNWKGGGSVQVGPVKYRIEPKIIRLPAPKTPQGVCEITRHEEYSLPPKHGIPDRPQQNYLDILIRGHGWNNSDHGEKIEKELEGCKVLPGSFKFDYGLGPHGREWEIKVKTKLAQESCIENAIKTASGTDSIHCKPT